MIDRLKLASLIERQTDPRRPSARNGLPVTGYNFPLTKEEWMVVIAALRTPPPEVAAHEQEPCAWRWKESGADQLPGWHFDGKPPLHAGAFDIEPLYPMPWATVSPLAAHSRDWTEDAGHENGRYNCVCVKCNNVFIGHKRRVMCKVCAAV